MNTCVMCSMLTIKPNTLLPKDLLLRPALVSYQGLPWILSLVKIPWLIDTVMWTGQLGSLNRSRRSTRQYKNSWKRARPSTRLGMISIGWSIVFKLETKSGCISARTGEGSLLVYLGKRQVVELEMTEIKANFRLGMKYKGLI